MTAIGSWIERFAATKVLVLGDVMLDRYVHGRVERMSPEAPIPVLRIEDERVAPGGAANVARNVASLGGRAILIGVTGDDPAAGLIEGGLRGEPQIRLCLLRDPGRSTTAKTRFCAGRHQILRADSETTAPLASALAASVLQAFEATLPQADVVVLSDYAKGVLSDAVLGPAIARANAAGKFVIADPKSAEFGRYRGADLLTPNRGELAAAVPLAGDADEAVAEAALQAIRQWGLSSLLVTRGEHGMTLAREGNAALHFPAVAREVFDPTGAGDTVAATLALAIGSGAPLPVAARLANLAAGIAVGRVGAATVTPGELADSLRARESLAAGTKVAALPEALRQIAAWREGGERIGFTNGCFDLLHAGHIALLGEGRAACDRLVVGLNTDASARRLKGADRPIQEESARASVLASLRSVDLVVPFAEDTPAALIEAIRPDLLIKGADYRKEQVVGRAFVESYGGRVMLVPLVPGNSTTGTIARIGARSSGQARG